MKRFTAEDPAGLAGGVNRHAYVGANPISRSDPQGLDWALTYPIMEAAFAPNHAVSSCGCSASTASPLRPGQVIPGAMATVGAAGLLTGLGIGLAQTSAEIAAVGIFGAAHAAHLGMAGLALGTGLGALAGVGIVGAMLLPDPLAPLSNNVYPVPCIP